MTVADWVAPGLEFFHSVRYGGVHFFKGFLRGGALLDENLRLKQELAALRAHEETHRQLFQENARLRALLQFKTQAPWKLIPAEVIGREFGPWSRTLLLNKGKADGVGEGMAVMTPVGMVGRVSEVGGSSSRVRLIVDAHFRVPAAVSEPRTTGLVMGSTAGECLLTYLALDAQVHPGQAVLTAGGNSFAPEGIPVGEVEAVSQDASELFLTARIRPAVAVHAVEEVVVVSE